ncbi:MAG TPA: cyclodeaminase/cyclohydrolase family protein [bacterium]|nr:cyclodeaminase/cyclohydrolase family protein [bacterium]HOL34274.1 cyclodeaminase/cyclohydrolase family protein [bacterium]HPP07670.1 cyclodeaminase/cyclohydrolase family protein [bacterium]
MEYEYLKEPLQKYIDRLSGKSPCPGGGSAAILSLALANALIVMVCNYTVDSSKVGENSRKISKDILDNALQIQPVLNKYVEQDSIIYRQIQETMKLLRKDPTRTKEHEDVLKKSIDLHIQILDYCKSMLHWNEMLMDHCNPYLISDVGVSTSLIEGVIRATVINVLINLVEIKDDKYAAEIKNKLQILSLLTDKAVDIIKKVGAKISLRT